MVLLQQSPLSIQMQVVDLRCFKSHKIQEVSIPVFLGEAWKRKRSFGQTQGPNPRGLTVYIWYCVIRVGLTTLCWAEHLLSSPLPRRRQSLPGGCSEAPFSWLVPECWGAGRHQYFGLASEVCGWPGGCLGWPQSWAREKKGWWEQPCIVQSMSKIQCTFCQAPPASSSHYSWAPLLLLQGGNTVQVSRQNRTRHGKLRGILLTNSPLPQGAAPGNSPIIHMALVRVLSTSLASKEWPGLRAAVVSLFLSSRALQVGCITHCMTAAPLAAVAEGPGASTEQTASQGGTCGLEQHCRTNDPTHAADGSWMTAPGTAACLEVPSLGMCPSNVYLPVQSKEHLIPHFCLAWRRGKAAHIQHSTPVLHTSCFPKADGSPDVLVSTHKCISL